MKKLIAVAAIAAMPFTQAVADDNIGCGLGSMLWAGQSGLPAHVLGATTNGTSGNQTFGITFGTLGCDGNGEITSRETLAKFTAANLDQIMTDSARGSGESLEVLAELYGIEAEQHAAFAEKLQENFATIFSSENVTAEHVLAAIDSLQS